MSKQRDRLSSRLGFILLSAGCAIGIGNVYKFPYIVGQYGGGIFVLIYLFFLVILGVPVMAMEFSIGRAARKSPIKMYQELEPKGSKWHIHGKIALAGNYLVLMSYTTVSGWMLRYFAAMAGGELSGMDASGIASFHQGVLDNPVSMTICMGIVVALAVLVCGIGLQNGLEKVTKFMMIALLAIMALLAINSFFMEGAAEGLSFYLVPSFQRMKEAGIGSVIVNAMNQAFFTLSLGMGSMAIFGSYFDKDRSLLGESINIAALDTVVAFTSGLIIFPACFAYGVDVESGTSLIFNTLPNIFEHMPLGRLWGSLFFIFMSFAALSTIFTVFETIIACTMDQFGFSRKKASIVNGILLFILSLPCVFGFNLLSGITPLGAGSNIMALEDFIVSYLVLPLGSLVFVLFCVSKKGWGFDNFFAEVNTGKGLKVRRFMKGYLTYVLPAIILLIFAIGLYDFFR